MSEPMHSSRTVHAGQKWHRRCVAALIVVAMAGCDGAGPNLSAKNDLRQEASLARSEVRADPARCPGGGDGHTYFALGRTVVRLPYADRIHVARDPVAPVPALQPPEPSASEGCRGNPIQVRVLHLVAQQDALLGRHAQGTQPLRALDILRRPMQGVVRSDGESLLGLIAKQTPCRTIDGDLVECVKPGATSTTPSVLTVRQDVHSTPTGRPFVVKCGFGPGIYNDDCSIGYQLDENTALRYRIDRRKTPDRDIVALDKAVRDGLCRLILPSYPWKDGTP